MKSIKKLELYHSRETYTDNNGNEREYDKFYTVVNGIEIQLVLGKGNSTGRDILTKYFKGELL